MTPSRTERRTDHAEDHADRGADHAGARHHEGQLTQVPHPIPAAPRCGRDRDRPRLKSTIEVLAQGDRLILMRAGQGADVALDGDPQVLAELLALLDGTRGPVEVLGALRATVAPALGAEDLDEALAALAADGLTEDAADDARHLDPDGLERYDRQLRYFGDLATADGPPRAAAQARLERATVAVLGLGGLGGMAATMLTVCGVGTIVGVDHDVVELSNLARQVLYGQDDLGRLKVDAAAGRLRQLNARSRFRGIARRLDSTASVAGAIAGADFVVAAVDWPADRISGWVNDACWAAGIPYVGMSQHPPLVRVGPTYLPGATGCLACQEAAYRRRFPLFDAAKAAISDSSPAATYAPACGLIGSLVANEAIAHITGLAPVACAGRSTVIDLTTLAVTHEDVPRDPDCPVCGDVVAGSTMRPGG
jgi:bacteriocin biosynthesis cyclodehydratase domain-containing protein